MEGFAWNSERIIRPSCTQQWYYLDTVSACNVKWRNKRLRNVEQKLQLSTCSRAEEVRWVSSANQNCSSEVIGPIVPTQNDACRTPEWTAVDNANPFQTSTKVNGSHHHGYWNRHSNTGSTLVQSSLKLSHEIPSSLPQTGDSTNAKRTVPHCSYADADMVVEKSAGAFLIWRLLLDVGSRLQKAISEHSRKQGERVTQYVIVQQ